MEEYRRVEPVEKRQRQGDDAIGGQVQAIHLLPIDCKRQHETEQGVDVKKDAHGGGFEPLQRIEIEKKREDGQEDGDERDQEIEPAFLWNGTMIHRIKRQEQQA